MTRVTDELVYGLTNVGVILFCVSVGKQRICSASFNPAGRRLLHDLHDRLHASKLQQVSIASH